MRFLKISLKPILRDLSWSLLLGFVYLISSLGFISIHGMRVSVEESLKSRIKNSLAADIAVSNRETITQKEIDQILTSSNALESSTLFEFFAMLSTKSDSKLVLVRAVDSHYPLYGALTDTSEQPISFKDIQSQIVVDSNLFNTWNLTKSDALTLGNVSFKLHPQVIQNDPTQTFRLGNLAPRIYISLNDLDKTGLIAFGSTFTHSVLLKLAPSSSPELTKKKIQDQLNNPEITVSTTEDTSNQMSRPIRVLGDFLSLLSISSLVLANLAFLYLSRLYFYKRLPSFSIFQILGARPVHIAWMTTGELILIGLSSLLVASALSYLIIPLASQYLFSEFQASLDSLRLWEPMLLSCANYVIVLLSFFFPEVYRLNLYEAFSKLDFSSSYTSARKLGIQNIFTLLPFLWIILVSFWVAPSTQLLLSYVTVIFLLALLTLGLSFLALHLFKYLMTRPIIHLSIKRFIRAPKIFIMSVTTITLCTSLILLTQFLSLKISSELSSPQSDRPSLFVFDISDEIKNSLTDFLSKKSIEPMGFSPLIRGRILKVNQQAFEKNLENSNLTREQELEARFRNRGLNLTVRNTLSSTETLISELENPDPSKLPLSIEQRFSSRLSLKLGDILTLEIQGLEFDSQVTQIRSVRWNSFLPNFFVQTTEGWLDDAPKSWLLGIPVPTTQIKAELMKELSKNFPSATILDIELIIRQLIKWTQDFAKILSFTTISQLLIGLALIGLLLALELKSRDTEYKLYSYLGVTKSQIQKQKLFEIGFMLTLSLMIALGFSAITSEILVTLLLK